jgi:hypothetical protein
MPNIDRTSAGEARRRLLRARAAGDHHGALDALAALSARGERGIPPLVEAVLEGAERGWLGRMLRCRALETLRLEASQDDMAVGAFVAASRDPDLHVAATAAAALGDCSSQRDRAVRALAPLARHRAVLLRQAASAALVRLSQPDDQPHDQPDGQPDGQPDDEPPARSGTLPRRASLAGRSPQRHARSA